MLQVLENSMPLISVSIFLCVHLRTCGFNGEDFQSYDANVSNANIFWEQGLIPQDIGGGWGVLCGLRVPAGPSQRSNFIHSGLNNHSN